MAADLKTRTVSVLRDLHARESMRLGWYRQHTASDAHLQTLRERKARQRAYLAELLRRRGAGPGWYSRLFYYLGHILGLVAARLPKRWSDFWLHTLEHWLLLRYQRYLRILRLDAGIRSMIEAIQLHRMAHDEPGQDVLELLNQHLEAEKQLLRQN
jgi:demethoxyubiquinone hydroxylase (CLK1/Coq7/Cat5 family)